jgi:hypothetical protein
LRAEKKKGKRGIYQKRKKPVMKRMIKKKPKGKLKERVRERKVCKEQILHVMERNNEAKSERFFCDQGVNWQCLLCQKQERHRGVGVEPRQHSTSEERKKEKASAEGK